MQKQKNPLPKRQRTIRVTSPEERAAQAKWENDHHKAIAGYYFDDTPTLPNLARGAYHWIMGNVFSSSEDPEDYEYITGEAPAVGPTGKLPKVVNSTSKKVIREVVGKRPEKTAEKVISNVRKIFDKGYSAGKREGVAEAASETANRMQQRVERAYRAGLGRGEQRGTINTSSRLGEELAAARQAQAQSAERVAQLEQELATAGQAGTQSSARIAQLEEELAAARQAAERATQTGQAAGQTATQASRGFWGNIGRVLWETKGNNFGPYYTVRNTFRVPGYMIGFPWIAGAIGGSAPRYFEYAGESFGKGYRAGIGDTSTVATSPTEKKDTVFINQSDSSQVSRSNTNPDTQFNPGKQVINNDSLTQEQLEALMEQLF